MKAFDALRISATGLSAERLRMDVISSNIANANSVRTEAGGPYKRQVALLASIDNKNTSFKNILNSEKNKNDSGKGVKIVGVVEDKSPLKMVYDPSHPDANADGYVAYPNVNVMKEMVELITASRSYDANITAMNTTKNMLLKTLEIGR